MDWRQCRSRTRRCLTIAGACDVSPECRTDTMPLSLYSLWQRPHPRTVPSGCGGLSRLPQQLAQEPAHALLLVLRYTFRRTTR